MNLLKKAFCRTFQTFFRIVLPILPYRDPKILEDTAEIPKLLSDRRIKSVLIVTDESLHRLGLLDKMKNALKESNISYTVYDGTVSNPTVENAEQARKMYIENKCSAIIAFGGGSPMDCAKAVGARIARPRKPLQKMRGILKILLPIPFLIAVPTTAGTGSEVTLAAVITDEKTGYKFPINDFSLIPKIAVLDADITKKLPQAITAATGMDALTHAIEAYIGRSTTRSTRRDALEAARIISENLIKAYTDGENHEARKNMLKAAYLAGRAFTKSYVGYCHSVAHSLGGKYNIPHGLANAVLLPYVLESYGSVIYKKSKDIALAMNICGKDTDEKTAYELLIKEIRRMNSEMSIPEKLPGIRKADIKELAAHAEKEANPLYPVPKLCTAEQLEIFYYNVMEK